ncbi:GMC oxidoreductase [Kaistia defluvii]|uniref:GMC oxidoreductase n=1 Tax=Kaistia defluvii TaxID=410841 RepID=UPI002256A56E|nr:GMC oxidoreductase [Kaistia defluvii]MCX5517848.1 GMC oxidoreductase [Kaistia defluvii]
MQEASEPTSGFPPSRARDRADPRFPPAELRTDEQILSYVRQYGSVDYHPAGTCRMGAGADAVVDPEDKLDGMDGIHVIDNSIMAYLNGGNTNAPAIMIGEKGAALVRGEAPLHEGA